MVWRRDPREVEAMSSADELEHDTDEECGWCWCNPTWERQDDGSFLVIHKEEQDATN
jgi:hypothetical protein